MTAKSDDEGDEDEWENITEEETIDEGTVLLNQMTAKSSDEGDEWEDITEEEGTVLLNPHYEFQETSDDVDLMEINSKNDESKNDEEQKDNLKISWDFGPNFSITQRYIETLTHVYDCSSFQNSSESQTDSYQNILIECIEFIIRRHRNKMNKELIKSFKSFPDKIGIQLSDSRQLFHGMEDEDELIGRAFRVAFYEKSTYLNNQHTIFSIPTPKKEISMIIAYADNIPYKAESERFIGIKCGELCFESRKFVLADDPPWTKWEPYVFNDYDIDNVHKDWKDVALIVGVTLINSLFDDRCRVNLGEYGEFDIDYYDDEDIDVSDLLPPFHDFKSLFNNDEKWWRKLKKNISCESSDDSGGHSNDNCTRITVPRNSSEHMRKLGDCLNDDDVDDESPPSKKRKVYY